LIIPTLAKRFLLSKASDGFISLIAWVSVVGVALGVLALVVVTSVINGFESELSRVITGMNGDVILYSKGESVAKPRAVEKKIRDALPQTAAITASFITELMVSGPNSAAGAIMEGVDFETLGTVTAVPERVAQGRLPTQLGDETAAPGLSGGAAVAPPPIEVALGSALAERIGAAIDTEVRVIIPDTDTGTPKSVKGKVVGIVRMGMYEYDSKYVFASLGNVQRLLGQPGNVTAFKIKLGSGADSRVAAEKLSDQFGYPFRAKDWAQLNKNLFYAIRLEKVVIAIILTVIVIVAAFNVVSTLMMMIHDKTREIAILKAMGLRPDQSFKLFALIGVGMGLVGTLVGSTLGIGVNALLARTRLIDLPADIYYISFLPVIVRWREVGMISLVAVAISFLATVYPAWKVSRRSPLEGLRYE
jgi:lipoprotein-releasing system permease protein